MKQSELFSAGRALFGLSLSLLLLCACARQGAVRPDEPGQPAGSSPPAVPFSLRVLEERNDGRNIFLAGEIESYSEWDRRDLLIHLSSYRSGELVRENFFHMPQNNAGQEDGGRVAAGEVSRFALSIPALEVTDYQIELLWGKDARQYRTRPEDGRLELRDIQLQSAECGQQVCEVPFIVTGNFFNSGSARIEEVRLAVSLVREGEAPPVAAEGEAGELEEAVEVAGLALAPGESRPFRISLAGEAYRDMPSSLKPYIRVLQVH